MVFRFVSTPEFDYLSSFSRHIQATASDGVLQIPAGLGRGYLRELAFEPDFKIILHDYTLNEDLSLTRIPSDSSNELITIFLYQNKQPLEVSFHNHPDVSFSQLEASAVHITSNDSSSTVRFPAHQPIHYLVVAITPARLNELVKTATPNPLVQTITGTRSSFHFFENLTAETRLLLKNIMAMNMRDALSNFYMQIKVQELLYFVIRQLTSRDKTGPQTIGSGDAERLSLIRDEIMRDLSVPPVLRKLAQVGAMSESKMKQLFKQTFGATIYTYYQQARMQEAAFLLRQRNQSVAQVGYEMGFSNLSHFSRLFEKHYGQNPKRFSYS